MTDRIDILQRILNLRALGERTTSEAEALNAISLADKLMQSYRVEEAELALAEGSGQIKVEIENKTRWDLGLKVGRNRHKAQACLWDLERYCEIEIVLKGDRGVHAIGDKPDVELFWHLLEVVRGGMDRAYNSWKRGQQGIGRGAKAAFQTSMAHAINTRLRAMTDERRQERADAEAAAAKLLNVDAADVRHAVANGDIKMLSSSRSLVIASLAEQKHKAVKEAYNEAYKGVKLGTASGFSYRGGHTAAAAGRAAGARLNLGRPIGASTNRRIQ